MTPIAVWSGPRQRSHAAEAARARLVSEVGDDALFARLFAVGARRRLKIRQAAAEMGLPPEVVEDLCRRRPMSQDVRRRLIRWLTRQERQARLGAGPGRPGRIGGYSAPTSAAERRAFGNAVALMRKASGLADETIAALVGISPATLSGIESGQHPADRHVRARLSAVLGLDGLTFRRLAERGQMLSTVRFGL